MLKISRLVKRFDELDVLDGFDLEIPRGSFAVLIGPSGCGKTTLFDLLTGVVSPDAGTVSWMGDVIPDAGRVAAYMQQKDLLLPWRSLMDNALLPTTIAGADPAASREKAAALFQRMGLHGFEAYLPGEISGGMRQRCALVRTLMFERELVLLDEPLSALDAITRRSLHGLLLMLQQAFHRTLLMITHDIEEGLLLADDLYVLSQMPMNVLCRCRLKAPKPRRPDDPELIRAKTAVMARLDRELNNDPR
ncbi:MULTISPECIES: ABC transporter ATP-binding protein [Desulfococcus]|uniref:ABC transporter related protein n=1 Tax=Desulfococcus multivorans DSM 2059 TaxID=1121405 RepID=S7TTT9_DESML|nr:ABC transporter ATP-binding protein [Desulfococcus multivorans]AQV02971.1 toluene ABC transporter ATP-binding protein [Desulfococcus multivorans]EPR40155.1 ABC transporter related protein [Desulfococcus multivorans DSM 2059]MDX9820136.1 ABC transporter ATP-binding protein [Desulfococcus multivorans]SJZ46560.1 NitT/TauT family transport system ATP-binding protein [Desulfococcus multivorans DSM 2059]